MRAHVLRRDGYRCRWCGGPATEVHHVLARALGGTDAPANLRSICGACHLRLSQALAAAQRARLRGYDR